MPQHTVKVKIDGHWVRHYNQTGTHLCMARLMQVSEHCPSFTVAAIVIKNVDDVVDITWEDQFAITISEEAWAQGAVIQDYEDRLPVKTGDLIELDRPERGPRVIRRQVGGQALRFTAPEASSRVPVIYMKTRGNYVPVWTSQMTLVSDDSTNPTVTPLQKVIFWWQQNLESGTVISSAVGPAWDVTTDPEQPVTIYYTKHGLWSNLPPSTSREHIGAIRMAQTPGTFTLRRFLTDDNGESLTTE